MAVQKDEQGLLAERARIRRRSLGHVSSGSEERCYCGTVMVQINSCRYRCPNCGMLLDCEDVSGLPK